MKELEMSFEEDGSELKVRYKSSLPVGTQVLTIDILVLERYAPGSVARFTADSCLSAKIKSR